MTVVQAVEPWRRAATAVGGTRPYLDTMRMSLRSRIEQRVDRKRGDVFLREDFSDLGGCDPAGRGLWLLVKEGRLIRLGQAVYSCARVSPISGVLVPPKGLTTLTEALNRLGIETLPSRLERD